MATVADIPTEVQFFKKILFLHSTEKKYQISINFRVDTHASIG